MNTTEFISIIKAHQNLIYKVCHSYCTNHEARKDLQQEILAQLWHAIPKFDGRVKISTWIYRIALNTAISFYRKDCTEKKHSQTINDSLISFYSTQEEEEMNENIKLLYQFINTLKPFDKALILLYLDNYKHQEIADTLGISTTNVATKIGRIKQNLKLQFENL